MKTIALYEAKNRLSELIAEVETGVSFEITRRGKPVARLVALDPPSEPAMRRDIADAFEALARLRGHLDLDGDIKAIAREGLR